MFCTTAQLSPALIDIGSPVNCAEIAHNGVSVLLNLSFSLLFSALPKTHRYAQKNLTDEMALNELLKEVQGLRELVQERQSLLRPKMEQVHLALQEDPRAPVIEMMQDAAIEAERSSREIIDAGGAGGIVRSLRSNLPFRNNVPVCVYR